VNLFGLVNSRNEVKTDKETSDHKATDGVQEVTGDGKAFELLSVRQYKGAGIIVDFYLLHMCCLFF
jgi:hypothetical protein